MFLYVEQDVNLTWQSCSGLKNEKNSIEKCKKIREKVVLQLGRNGLKNRKQNWALSVLLNILIIKNDFFAFL